MSAAIKIYTRPGCGYCSAAKSLLARKKAAFTEFDIAKNAAWRQEMYDRAGEGSTFTLTLPLPPGAAAPVRMGPALVQSNGTAEDSAPTAAVASAAAGTGRRLCGTWKSQQLPASIMAASLSRSAGGLAG